MGGAALYVESNLDSALNQSSPHRQPESRDERIDLDRIQLRQIPTGDTLSPKQILRARPYSSALSGRGGAEGRAIGGYHDGDEFIESGAAEGD